MGVIISVLRMRVITANVCSVKDSPTGEDIERFLNIIISKVKAIGYNVPSVV
jgi:hypothetical protein